MTKALLLTALLMLAPLPASSQSDDREARRGRDLEDLLRDIGDGGSGSRRGGAAFLLRSGDATVAVRCDPQDSMRACLDATLTLLDRARTMAPSTPRAERRPPAERPRDPNGSHSACGTRPETVSTEDGSCVGGGARRRLWTHG